MLRGSPARAGQAPGLGGCTTPRRLRRYFCCRPSPSPHPSSCTARPQLLPSCHMLSLHQLGYTLASHLLNSLVAGPESVFSDPLAPACRRLKRQKSGRRQWLWRCCRWARLGQTEPTGLDAGTLCLRLFCAPPLSAMVCLCRCCRWCRLGQRPLAWTPALSSWYSGPRRGCWLAFGSSPPRWFRLAGQAQTGLALLAAAAAAEMARGGGEVAVAAAALLSCSGR